MLLAIFDFFLFATVIMPQKADLVVQKGHSAAVNAISFSHNGKLLASGDSDGIVKVWDVDSGRELMTFKEDFFSEIRTLAFSPTGLELSADGYDGRIIFWDLLTREGKYIQTGPFNRVYSIAYSPDGSRLASSHRDGIVRLFDTTSGKSVGTFDGHEGVVYCVTYSADGQYLASSGLDGQIIIRSTSDPTYRPTILQDEGRIYSVSFIKDGQGLASSGDAGMKYWTIKSRRSIPLHPPSNQNSEKIVFSADGRKLVSGSGNKVLLWDSGVDSKPLQLEGHDWLVFSAAFSKDGSRFATGGSRAEVIIWDANTKRRTSKTGVFGGAMNNVVSYTERGDKIATQSIDSTIRVSDFASGGAPLALYQDCSIQTFLVSPDGQFLATACNDTRLSPERFIKMTDLNTRSEWKIKRDRPKTLELAFSSDSKYLAAGDNEGRVTVWDLARKDEIGVFSGQASVRSIAFSPTSKYIGVGDGDGGIFVWNLTDPKSPQVMPKHADDILVLGFARDERSIGSIGWDRKINVSNIESATLSRSIELSKGNKSEIEHLRDEYRLDNNPRSSPLMSNGWRSEMSRPVIVNKGALRIVNLESANESILIYEKNDREVVRLTALNNGGWVTSTLEGRFDTNKDLDNVEGLHWVISDDPFTPKPLDLFMRQYYEPNLLQRLMKCTMERFPNKPDPCDMEFKPLPPISAINRVQPVVGRPTAVSAPSVSARADGTVDVTVEVQSAKEELTRDGKKVVVSSGVYDLRLFRDGQLVGSSTTREATEKYILGAPAAVAKDLVSKELLNTEENKLWRDANDMAKVVNFDDAGKATYTFRNIKLPRDGRKEVEFSAYAFNSDRVKSETVQAIHPLTDTAIRKGKTYLISIGVNASENPNRVLYQSAKVATKTQEILAPRLVAGSENVVGVSLVSRYRSDTSTELADNNATKAKIKAVFNILGGNGTEADRAVLAGVSNVEKLRQIEPEDELVIVYSGHGFRDANGFSSCCPTTLGETRRHRGPRAE